MSDEELEAYIKTIEPNFYSHLEKGTIEMSNEYFNLLEERMARLINENQELKTKIKTYEDPEDLTLMFMYCDEKAKDKIKELEEENFNLRENIYIEKMSFPNEGRNIKELIEMPTYEDLLNQQKEFIEYMSKTIEELECDDVGDEELKGYLIQRIDTFKEILSKYYEIIGG